MKRVRRVRGGGQLDEELARAILAYRKARGWDQHAMAAHLGCSQSLVSRWETGANGFNLANAAGIARMIGLELRLVPLEGLQGRQESGQDPEQ